MQRFVLPARFFELTREVRQILNLIFNAMNLVC